MLIIGAFHSAHSGIIAHIEPLTHYEQRISCTIMHAIAGVNRAHYRLISEHT